MRTVLFGDFLERKSYLSFKVLAGNASANCRVRINGSFEEVLRWYNQRGNTSENRIKDLKIGFGMERMPCEQTQANAVFFRIGAQKS